MKERLKASRRPGLRYTNIFFLSLIFLFLPLEASAGVSFHKMLRALVENDLLHDELHRDSDLGRKFCVALEGQDCFRVTTFGQGICYAGGGNFYTCGSISSIGQGICYAGGGNFYTCGSISSIGQGICYAGGGNFYTCGSIRSIKDGYEMYLMNFKDREWDWDEFLDQYGNLVWICRGVQTGQFADNEKCDGKYQTDRRWPRKSQP